MEKLPYISEITLEVINDIICQSNIHTAELNNIRDILLTQNDIIRKLTKRIEDLEQKIKDDECFDKAEVVEEFFKS